MTIDYNKYIGIPWECGRADLDGADCWGLVSMVYVELYGVALNHFSINEIDDSEKTADKIEEVRDGSNDWQLVSIPREGDVIMMISRKTLRPEHVGVYINNGQVLHSLTRETGQSEVHPMKVLKRIFKRLEFYRYVA